MKKNQRSMLLQLEDRLKKFKWHCCLPVIFFLGFVCPTLGQSQTKRITLNLKDATMEEFVKQVKEQTGVTFFYNDDALAVIEPITIRREKVTLEEVLKEVVGAKGFTFVIDDNTVVIKKEVPQPQRQVILGVIVDENGETLPGVTVQVKGTTLGTSTDMEGKFTLMLPDQKDLRLIFSFIGWRVRRLLIPDRKSCEW